MAFFWKPYVPVAQRRANAKKKIEELRRKGQDIQSVEIEGRTIARSFWGKGWCDHLESFSDFENRLPRGRTYVRNGSVCHLEIKSGRIEALVCGSELYKITVKIEPLKKAAWEAVKDRCRGQIGSLLELLQGRLSDHVMAVVSDRQHGLFPQPGEIKLDCSCPDWADMCKHVAAVLYGVGSRLDSRPELLFILRGVEAAELIAAEVALPLNGGSAEDTLAEAGLAELFGIDLETFSVSPIPPRALQPSVPVVPKPKKPVKKTPAKLSRKLRSKLNLKKSPTMPAKAPRAVTKPMKAKEAALAKSPRPAAKNGRRAAKTASSPAFNPNAPTGAAIVRLRAQSGLSALQFARAVGVSVASVRRWEDLPGALRIQARPLAALTRLQDRLVGRKASLPSGRK